MSLQTCQKKTISSRSNSLQLWVFVLFLLALVIILFLDLAVGSVEIPLKSVLNILLGQAGEKSSWTDIMLKIRLPKAITAMLVGAAL
jgi:iron complex transport system permease protein